MGIAHTLRSINRATRLKKGYPKRDPKTGEVTVTRKPLGSTRKKKAPVTVTVKPKMTTHQDKMDQEHKLGLYRDIVGRGKRAKKQKK